MSSAYRYEERELELRAAAIECGDYLISAGRYVGAATRMIDDEGARFMMLMLEVGADGVQLVRFDLDRTVRVRREFRMGVSA